MSQLATQQVERVDVLFGDLSRRAEQTMAVVQQAIITPARESAALFSALRSTFAAIRGLRGNGASRPAARRRGRRRPLHRLNSRLTGLHCRERRCNCPETKPVSAGRF